MNIVYQENVELDRKQVLRLYTDVGWTAYTQNPNLLMEGIKSSLKVITAWHQNQLVGLVRVVGDGRTIIYIQDILVLESFQRQGIGSTLLRKIFAEYSHVRQILLLTEADAKTTGFYIKNGMADIASWDGIAFMKN